jgi:branched-subunit amino acid aminotransferase/4-amino-4-deoxychorismate lyase
VEEKRISLTEFYVADEVFTTGTMGELTPVVSIDGRIIGNEDAVVIVEAGISKWPVLSRIQKSFRLLTETEGVPIPH